MKIINALFILFFLPLMLLAQQSQGTTIGASGIVSISPVVQSWSLDGNNDFTEFSTSLYARYPVLGSSTLSLRLGQANVTGQTPKISGITDMQVSYSYHLESVNTVLNAAVNVPTGKKQLDSQQFQTSTLISNTIFDLQYPNFGQGLNVRVGATHAFEINENLVLGAGMSYQYKGKYKPLTGLDNYDPGDELLVTAGFDTRFTTSATFSGDVIFTGYAADRYAGEKVFSAGNKWVLNLQFRKYFAYNELWLYAIYRTRAKNDFVIGGQMLPEVEKTIPDQFEFHGSYRMRLNQRFSLTYLGEMRFYQTTLSAFSAVNLYGLGLAPEYKVADNVVLGLQIKYLYGNIKNALKLSGLDAGLGVRFIL